MAPLRGGALRWSGRRSTGCDTTGRAPHDLPASPTIALGLHAISHSPHWLRLPQQPQHGRVGKAGGARSGTAADEPGGAAAAARGAAGPRCLWSAAGRAVFQSPARSRPMSSPTPLTVSRCDTGLFRPGDVALVHWGDEGCFLPDVHYVVAPPGAPHGPAAPPPPPPRPPSPRPLPPPSPPSPPPPSTPPHAHAYLPLHPHLQAHATTCGWSAAPRTRAAPPAHPRAGGRATRRSCAPHAQRTTVRGAPICMRRAAACSTSAAACVSAPKRPRATRPTAPPCSARWPRHAAALCTAWACGRRVSAP